MSKPRVSLGAPPTIDEVRGNIETPTPKTEKGSVRWINFRVGDASFKSIKKAALDEDMDLRAYMLHCHLTYQARKS